MMATTRTTGTMKKPYPMRTVTTILVLALTLSFAPPLQAQLGDLIKKTQKVQDKVRDKAKKASDIYTPWTDDQERVIGEASAAKLINVFGLYEQPDMVKYVNLVGSAVARNSTRNVAYHFAILDTEAVTALSLPGGYVFVTRGALANMKNEAELAGTLAHEIAHIDKRHLEKQVRTQKTVQFAKEETATHIPRGAELVAVAGEVVKNALTMPFSREHENEADRLGVEFASKTGYAASGLRDFLQVLAAAAVNPSTKQQLGLWGSTHPPLAERVTVLSALLAVYPSNGQVLQDRFNWFVNRVNFAKNPSQGAEFNGLVTNGVVVIQDGTLPEGAKVKVQVIQ
jgi:predicted Zn-dependent protease